MLWMVTDVFTRIGAAVGTALDVFNAWLNWRQRRVQAQLEPIRLQVPRFRSSLGGTDTSYVTSPGLKFINRSPFAVTPRNSGMSSATVTHTGLRGCQIIRVSDPGRCGLPTNCRSVWNRGASCAWPFGTMTSRRSWVRE
jgi:hypothetical protein